jgi:hypothetical protein
MSEMKSIDGKLLRIEEAVQEAFGAGLATIVSCIPDRLAYYEAETPGSRWLLVAADVRHREPRRQG